MVSFFIIFTVLSEIYLGVWSKEEIQNVFFFPDAIQSAQEHLLNNFPTDLKMPSLQYLKFPTMFGFTSLFAVK